MAGPEVVLEERDMSLEEYLGLFDADSVDYDLIKKRSDRLERIVVKKLRDAAGTVFEDTTFIERSGVTYTIRTRMG